MKISARWSVALLVMCAVAAGSALALAHTGEHVARMNGDKEVPGPGDPNGRGRAVIKSASEAETVCYKITFKGIRPATAAHIHEGTRTESGDVVVKLFEFDKPKRGPIDRCKHNVSGTLIEEIHDNPSGYYVNVHNRQFPDGAIRGQLKERS